MHTTSSVYFLFKKVEVFSYEAKLHKIQFLFIFGTNQGDCSTKFRPDDAKLNLITSENENTCLQKEDNYLHIGLERYRLKIKLAWVEK